jgi:HEPN domain-containing protein
MYNRRMENWQTQLKAEFDKATQARIKKNEGQSRVCARRAAGVAIREYFNRRETQPPNTSAIDLLNLLKEQPHLPADIREIVEHLTLRVTEEFDLPVQADLVAEARILCRWLLPDWR